MTASCAVCTWNAWVNADQTWHEMDGDDVIATWNVRDLDRRLTADLDAARECGVSLLWHAFLFVSQTVHVFETAYRCTRDAHLRSILSHEVLILSHFYDGHASPISWKGAMHVIPPSNAATTTTLTTVIGSSSMMKTHPAGSVMT